MIIIAIYSAPDEKIKKMQHFVLTTTIFNIKFQPQHLVRYFYSNTSYCGLREPIRGLRLREFWVRVSQKIHFTVCIQYANQNREEVSGASLPPNILKTATAIVPDHMRAFSQKLSLLATKAGMPSANSGDDIAAAAPCFGRMGKYSLDSLMSVVEARLLRQPLLQGLWTRCMAAC